MNKIKSNISKREGKVLTFITMSKVTAKGQITVPQVVRKSLSLKQGDRVAFIPEGQRIYIERLPKEVASDHVFGRLYRPDVQPLNWDEERERIKMARVRHYEEMTEDKVK